MGILPWILILIAGLALLLTGRYPRQLFEGERRATVALPDHQHTA